MLVSIALATARCGGGGESANGSGGTIPPPTPSVVSTPTRLNVYPVGASAGAPPRIFVLVATVGSQPVHLPVAFDTGSSGLTLNALAVFPSAMVSASGFVFDNSQTSLSYNGITVTDQQGSRTYGGPTGHTQIGNVGFAEITFGDSAGSLTTQTMPVLFYYKIISTATQQPVAEGTQQGWFGVNDAPNLITIDGGSTPYPACAASVNGSCWDVSIFKFLSFGAGVDGGFVVDPVRINSCDITTDGDCSPEPALVIGVNHASEAGFSLSPLPCPPLGYTGPPVIAGFSVCQEKVPGTTIASAAPPGGSYVAAALFDTGTPFNVLNVPSGTVFPSTISAGDTLQITTPSGFLYTTVSGSGVSTIIVNTGVDATASVIGLGYFTTNSLFVDFATGMQGWK
jgi:hypothetical protein